MLSSCPVCSVSAMAPKKDDPVLVRILKRIEQQHCGSGDADLEDAVDPCAFLTDRYGSDKAALTHRMKLAEKRLEDLDPNWAMGRLTPATSMFDKPRDGDIKSLTLSVYQVGFEKETSTKGKSKAVTILDCVEICWTNRTPVWWTPSERSHRLARPAPPLLSTQCGARLASPRVWPASSPYWPLTLWISQRSTCPVSRFV